MQDFRNKSATGIGGVVSFSDDEDTTLISGSKSTARGRKGSSSTSGGASELGTGKTSTRGRGRGRGRGRASSSNLKQTTLDGALGFRQSQR